MKVELSVLPWPCAICDVQGNLRETSALWQARFGALNELHGCLPEAMKKFGYALAKATDAQDSEPIATFDCVVRAAGELMPLTVRFAILPTSEQTPDLWLITVDKDGGAPEDTPSRDELDARQGEHHMDGVGMRLQARNWQALFHGAAVGKALIHLTGETLEVNRALCELSGYSEENMMGFKTRDIRHPDDRALVDANYQALIDGGPPVAGLEVRYLHKDGFYLTCLLSLSLIRDSRGRPLYFTAEVEDITAHRAAEARLREGAQQLERVNEELMRSNAALERFAFVASHDLQEPLRKIQIFGDRLIAHSADCKDDSDLVRYADGMMRSAERMQNLIRSLLDYGRLKDSPTPFVPVDLNALWAELADEFEAALSESNARLEVGVLPVVNGDTFRLQQLFANLLSNALKFRGAEAPIVMVRALTDAEFKDWPACVAIEVRDNGIGFEAAFAESIFQVFSRLHGRNKYPGTGIGLAICRRAARDHGGDVRAFSAPGAGARFIVTLAA